MAPVLVGTLAGPVYQRTPLNKPQKSRHASNAKIQDNGYNRQISLIHMRSMQRPRGLALDGELPPFPEKEGDNKQCDQLAGLKVPKKQTARH